MYTGLSFSPLEGAAAPSWGDITLSNKPQTKSSQTDDVDLNDVQHNIREIT